MNFKWEKLDTILVIQLARFGDFLQTTPLLASLKAALPNAHLAVMVNTSQKDLAQDNPDVDQVIPIDLSALERLSDNPNLPLGRKLELMHAELGALRELAFDLILNVNMSRVAALLAELSQAGHRLGPCLAPDRLHLQPAPWNFFIMNLMSRRRLIRFNLVDLLLSYSVSQNNHAQGLQFKAPAGALASGAELLGNKSGHGLLVGFQLGSRHQARQWPAEYFAALTKLLVEHHQAQIVFLGTEQEREIGQRVLDILSCQSPGLKKHIIDLMGRTSIPELAGVLTRIACLGHHGHRHYAFGSRHRDTNSRTFYRTGLLP